MPGTFQSHQKQPGCDLCANGTASSETGRVSACDECEDPTLCTRFGQTAPLADSGEAAGGGPDSSDDKEFLRPKRVVFTRGQDSIDDSDDIQIQLAAALLVSLTVLCIAIHAYIPEALYSRVDITALNHRITKQGSGPSLQNTPLGSAWTLSFFFLALLIGLALISANATVEQSSLEPPLTGQAVATTNIELTVLTSTAGSPLTASTCGVVAPPMLAGLKCQQVAPASPGGTEGECAYKWEACKFSQAEAQITCCSTEIATPCRRGRCPP